MEVPEINIISNFEAGIMKYIQNPSLLSRFLSISGMEKLPQMYSLMKWGALILALVATFTGIKRLIIRLRTLKSLAPNSQPLLQQLDYDSDESEDDKSSTESVSDDEDAESTSPSGYREPVDDEEDQSESRNSKLRRRRSGLDLFSWSDFEDGKSVVKLWDSLGLGLGFDDSSEKDISIWDLDTDQKIGSFFGGKYQVPALAMSSPALMLFAGVNDGDSVALGAYDTREGRQTPAIYAEWGPRQGKVVGINSGGVEKVYVREGVTGMLTFGDMRNVKTPLENLTESDGDTWWDADAVMKED